jgi:aryl-alcohol dehydrogenase-like predicted oxidoreductase
MEYRPLGNTEIRVSSLCLGTMTFGEQNSEAEAHRQLDAALDAGVNFIDTAEMYPVPPRQETQGQTERFIGNWLARRGDRDKLILATKVAGPGRDWLPYIRGGGNRLDRRNIEAAVDASLKRLQSDVIDLYQLHWPDRHTNYFGRLGYTHQEDTEATPLLETLQVLDDLVRAGKIRHVGLSNETPWGVMKCLAVAEQHGLPRVVSVQNPYSLLNRSFEVGLAEIAHRESTGLLAYSPLGFGVLSGKYLDGAQPEGARLTRYQNYTRYSNPEAQAATYAYVELAREHDLDPAQMALAYVTSRPFVTSTIIGATSMEQLSSNLDSAALPLSAEVLADIEAIHNRHPNPSP